MIQVSRLRIHSQLTGAPANNPEETTDITSATSLMEKVELAMAVTRRIDQGNMRLLSCTDVSTRAGPPVRLFLALHYCLFGDLTVAPAEGSVSAI